VSAERRDLALILARGESRRMGRPKGLCVADDDPRPLIVRVAAPYLERDGCVAVITTPDLVDAYAAVLDDPRVLWIAAPGGGGTARSVLIGRDALADRVTHLWLHPVDLPRVRPATLTALAERSGGDPGAAYAPECGGRPGHPVVLPKNLAGADWPDDHDGAMRDLFADGPGLPNRVVCDDPGVTDDLDTPDDLGSRADPNDRGDK